MFKVKYYVLLIMIMFFATVQSWATGEDLIGELPNLAITAETEQARLRGIRLRLTRADEAILDRLHAQEETLILSDSSKRRRRSSSTTTGRSRRSSCTVHANCK
ncbi:MAG: hypothetical protein LBI93_03790 [Endomicrobium sp.]|nr:hypothetical protein [Endomicrobium sp.]